MVLAEEVKEKTQYSLCVYEEDSYPHVGTIMKGDIKMHNNVKKVGFILLAIFFMFSAGGCGGGGKEGDISPSTRLTYTVNFITNGGSFVPSIQVYSGERIIVPNPPPTRVGYRLEDWYSDPELTNRFDLATPVTQNVNLYAKWTPIEIGGTYSVSFVSNGGSFVPSIQVYSGERIIVPNPPPTRVGYRLEDWYSDPELLYRFNFGTPIIKNTTLYANWTPIEIGGTYSVSFVSNGGSSVPSMQVNNGEMILVPNPPPTRVGYRLEDWYSDPGLLYRYNFAVPITQNVTLYANWTPIEIGGTYSVSFESNGGSSIPSMLVNNGEMILVPNPPTRADFDFLGWFSDPGLLYRYNFADPITQNITLYANWTPSLSVNRFEIGPYKGDDRIKYSYSYGGYDFYYIYLGELRNTPMFYEESFHFGVTNEMMYEFSTEETNSISILNTVSQSSQTARSEVSENTVSRTNGQKVGVELSGKFGLKAKDINKTNLGIKLNGELSWSQHTSNRNETGFVETTSLTDTVEYVSSYTVSNRRTFTWPLSLSRGDRVGYYRQTLFVASDVYLYVIKDSTGVIYYELIEHVSSNPFWRLDYSETSSFTKSDATVFEFDVTLLDNLPPAGTVTVTFDKNNSDSDATEADPQTRMVNVGQRVGMLMPTSPTRAGHTFVGWNSVANGSGTTFTADSAVTSSITVYAQWVSVPTYTLTANPNPTVGGSIDPRSVSNIFAGTSVNITAIPSSQYKFINWTVEGGTVSFGNANSLNTMVTLYGNATIRANFEPIIYTLTLDRNITAGGSINPASPSDVAAGTPVTISAIPNSGYRFAGWTIMSGQVDLINADIQSTTLTLKSNATVRANFELEEYRLNVNRYPTNWGTAAPVSGTYSANTPISISATPSNGYRFISWTELGGTAIFGNANIESTNITLRSHTTIRADFLPTSANFQGEVGKLSLKVTGAFIARLHISYLDEGGSEKRVKAGGDILAQQTRTVDPGNYGISDGTMVRVYSEVVGGYNRQGVQYFRYRSGNHRTASYTHSGTTLIGNTLSFNGVN